MDSLGKYVLPLIALLWVGLSLPVPAVYAASPPIIFSIADAKDGAITVPDPKTDGAISVTGDGQTPVKVWLYSWWLHRFVVEKDGSVTLEDQHASAQRITMHRVPAVFFIDGAGVLLPSLQPVNISAFSAKSSGGDAPRGGPVLAPALPKPSQPGEIVAVLVRNDTQVDLPSRVVTFGQAFAPGDFPDGDVLEAKTQNGTVAVQADIKARYPDRSVKHAVISLEAPALAHDANVAVMLSARSGTPSGALITPQTILAHGYDLLLRREFPATSGLPDLSVDAASLLESSAADSSITTWLSGPLASEYRVSKRIMPNFRITFDIRATADGGVRTDVIMSNDLAYLFPQPSVYSATVTQSGMATWKSPLLNHRRFQEWHKVFWNRETPMPSVVLDVGYLEKAGAVPDFDLSLGVSRDALRQGLTSVAKAEGEPLGAGPVMRKMATTGGRADIGPTTDWAANYLVSQDSDARTLMLAAADAAGSIPWHVRELDGRIVSALNHPRLFLDPRCKTVDCVPGGFVDPNSGWELDNAHTPDLAYVPYLTTGSHFYLDQLLAEANWIVLCQDPDYRKDATGLLLALSQVRGVAWSLREIANASWIAPDDEPLKAYFQSVFDNNMAALTQTYLVDRAMLPTGAIEGFVENPYDKTTVAPWQQDFLAITMSTQARRGLEPARKFAAWMTNFVAGRFTHGAEGFNPLHGPDYYSAYIDPQTKQPVNTWEKLYNLNFAGKPAPTKLDGTPQSKDDYAAIARAATASLFSVTQQPRALRAFAFLSANAEDMLKAFSNGNAFNINPRFADGHVLQDDEILYPAPGGGRLAAKTAHSMLIGGAGQITLQGMPGVTVMVGGSGATTMIGAKGANYFFAGAGDAAMAGAAGQNYFGLAAGRAQIDLAATDTAVDRIEGFKPGRDHVHLIGSETDLGKIIATGRKAESGSTVLTVGPGHTVEFVGLSPSDVSPAFFD
ncbi:hypothetical protein [Aliidongia dinghuensis]|uniref:hypothetical protein n=1 Tax=Aliidongia dinghuensis TaxID=1867774 RepID=UPI0016656E5F|nr:hypothetical protein [Aliidongia dinghuensis]